MGKNNLHAFAVVALASVCGVNGIFNIEQGGLKIKFPSTAASAHPDGFDMSLGNFGTPLYGGTLQGKLAYIESGHGYDNKCSPECRFGCQAFNASQPPIQLNRADQYIMLIDRGPTNSFSTACTFTEKVWNAQNAGAVAVLVVNYDDTHTTMDSPDEDDEDKNMRYLSQLTIPAAFITKSTGDILKELITTDIAEEAYVVMDWTDVLPKASKVKWQFWSGSNDMCGAKCDIQKEFIKQFVPAAKELEAQNWTEFQPHYLTNLCPEVDVRSNQCTTQCIHQGRYCAPDPDGSIEEGYSGGQVVQENLRQLCVFQLGNATGKPWVWWEYVTKFGEQCTMAANQYSKECAERIFQEVGGTSWSTLQAFRECAGSTDEDRENPLLEAELKSRQGDGDDVGEIYILPTIRINGGQYRGRLSYTEVFRAVCAGFDRNAEPEACARLSDDSCVAGSLGEMTCAANSNGKTKCRNTFSGYSCQCGNCYNEFVDKHGLASCQPKCDLKSCDDATGICQSGSGVGVLGVALMILVALTVVAGGGFAAYKWRIRQEMRDEVKSILKQYMPLAEGDDGPGPIPNPKIEDV